MPVRLSDLRSRYSWRAALLVLLGNLIPAAGVLVWGWDAASILFLYWCENVVIGLMTLPRLLTAQGSIAETPARPGTIRIPLGDLAGRLFLTAFFIVHYGLFCVGHALFLGVLASDFVGDPLGRALALLHQRDFRIALAVAFGVQLVLLVKDWFLSGAWRRSDPGTEMTRPYRRILVLHMTVILGAWMVGFVGPSTSAVLTLCLFKAAAEILALAKCPEPKAA